MLLNRRLAHLPWIVRKGRPPDIVQVGQRTWLVDRIVRKRG
jgi:hypothetical protein